MSEMFPAMTERPCGDGADARYCETFWAQRAELERLRAELDAARSARTAAEADSGTLRAEVRDLREKLRVVIDETPPELRYDWADQYLQEGPGADA